MFEQAFKNIDNALRKEAGCTTELDYTEQTSWLLFLKYLEGLEQDKAAVAKLEGKKYRFNVGLHLKNIYRDKELSASTTTEDFSVVRREGGRQVTRKVKHYINQSKKSKDPNYCQRVTANDGDPGDQHLRDFQDNEKTIPTILTTSQKLSTGVDARNIRNIVLMRPINSIIEFKQIIGRGTRLYDGKDYFTIYDFVKAHHHFSDPEWDGEPIDNTTTKTDASSTGRRTTAKEPEEKYDTKKAKARVRLADGKARTIQHMMCTTFWHPDGTPMSAQQFMEMLFGRLPDFFKNEAELREIWSVPDTRSKLLQGLAEKGFGRDQLAEMQKIIDAEKSDLFDVLAHVAYAMPPQTREERAANAKVIISTRFNSKQRVFLDFVLSHYVSAGVDELDKEKLTPLLRLKYHDSIADAIADLGKPEEIGKVFTGFQRYLYQRQSAG